MIKSVFSLHATAVFCFIRLAPSLKPAFPFRGLSKFIYLFTYFERQNGLPASFAQPSWIPSNSSSTPSFTHPNPTAAGHLGNAAARRMVQVRKSQEGDFQSFRFVPSISNTSLAPFVPLHHAALPSIQALLCSCQSPPRLQPCLGLLPSTHPPQPNTLT